MTRKHYIKFAEILGQAKYEARRDGLDTDQVVNRITNEIAEFCKLDNAGFNEGTFFAATNKAERDARG